MTRFRNKTLSQKPIQAQVSSLDQEGRGVAHVDNKVVFVTGALPGEEVLFKRVEWHKHYDVGQVLEVLTPSLARVPAKCPHYTLCGGCSLQHMMPEQQLTAKQGIMLDNLKRLGKVTPELVLEPLTGPYWGYRRKARLGIKHRNKKGKVLVGFRERHTNFLADLTRCEVLHPVIGERLELLSDMLGTLEAFDKIAQVEVAVAEPQTALVFRNLVALSAADEARLKAFSDQNGFAIYLQPKGPESAYLLWPPATEMYYRLDAYDIKIWFQPTDFTQVNSEINEKMVSRALELLDLQPEDRILDLFCGLGNFSLPMARRVKHVVGVEGEGGLVGRARENAKRNDIGNIEFHVANLAEEVSDLPWMRQRHDKILLDPPRNGAHTLIPQIAKLKARRIVYVSCNPATLARDAGELVHKHGYRLVSAGVMDMFPHTGHVESIALFVRD